MQDSARGSAVAREGENDRGSNVSAKRRSRRRWSAEEKARVVRESLRPGKRVGEVAGRYGISRWQLSTWRSLARRGKLAVASSVEPVIVRPLLAAWKTEKEKIDAAIAKQDKSRPVRRRRRTGAVRINASQGLLNAFLKRLQDFTVLDPACGSGNFLYLALHALKDIEHRVNLEAEAMGPERSFPAVGPANVKGIEINAYAAELARVSVWIGDIQWMRRNGFRESRDPILKPLETIECRDAILAADDTEPDWPDADAIIGNPPFLGGKLLIGGLGEDYPDFANSA